VVLKGKRLWIYHSLAVNSSHTLIHSVVLFVNVEDIRRTDVRISIVKTVYRSYNKSYVNTQGI
jgi:hypothetical protein